MEKDLGAIKGWALALVLVFGLSACSMMTELMGLDFESQLSDFTKQLEIFRETAKEVDKDKAD